MKGTETLFQSPVENRKVYGEIYIYIYIYISIYIYVSTYICLHETHMENQWFLKDEEQESSTKDTALHLANLAFYL